MQEHYVGVPEEGGGGLIEQDPLPVGSVYGASLTDSDTVALFRLETGRMAGSGKLRITGNPDRATKESLVTAFDFMRARKASLGLERDLDDYDFHVQVVDLLQGHGGSQCGLALFVALYSLLRERPTLAGLVVLGDITIQGNVVPLRSLIEPLQHIGDHGARKVLIPVSNKRHFLEVPGDVLEKIDPIFYSEPLNAALKALAMS